MLSGGVAREWICKQDRVEETANEACYFSWNLASAWPHKELWSVDNITELSHSKARSLAFGTFVLVCHWLCAVSEMGHISSWDFLDKVTLAKGNSLKISTVSC